jgi:hypothetical protein
MLSLPAIACSNNPDIAGKAIVELDGETVVYDTGDDGRHFVKTGESWSTSCDAIGGRLSMLLQRAYDDDLPISFISLEATPTKLINGIPVRNVGVYLGHDAYYGLCHVVATVGDDDPHEVDFSTTDCAMDRALDGHPALLVSASFHVKECENE